MTIALLAVETFLTHRYGRAAVRDVAPLGKGEWSQAFAFRHHGAALVIRLGAHVEDFEKDRRAAGFASGDLVIPRVHEVGRAFDSYRYCISERAFGEMLDGLDASRMRATLPSLFSVFDAMRTADLGRTAGFGGWSADGNAPYPSWQAYLLDVENDPPSSRIHGWKPLLAASPFGETPFDEAMAELRSLVGVCPGTRHLLHADLLNFNVLVSGDRVSAVIDWGNALYGDFLYDLALFSFYAPWYPAMRGIDWADEAERHYDAVRLTVPNLKERLRCYELHLGLGGVAYCAYTGRWDQLQETVQRLRALPPVQ